MKTREGKDTHRGFGGPAISVLGAVAFAILINGALAIWTDAFKDSASFQDAGVRPGGLLAPPGWVVGSVWVVLFGLLGFARWRLIRTGADAGRRAASWVIALVFVCALYPLYTGGLRNPVVGLAGNIVTAVLAGLLAERVRRIDRRSAGAIALVVFWLCYASLAIGAQLGWLGAN